MGEEFHIGVAGVAAAAERCRDIAEGIDRIPRSCASGTTTAEIDSGLYEAERAFETALRSFAAQLRVAEIAISRLTETSDRSAAR